MSIWKPQTKPLQVLLLSLCTIAVYHTLPAWAAVSEAEAQMAAQQQLDIVTQASHQALRRLNEVDAHLEVLRRGNYWGHNAQGQDVTWAPVEGLLQPVIFPFGHVSNEETPAWIRWSSGLQLASTMLGAGAMAYSPRHMYEIAAGWAVTYALLALIPSVVVATHDSSMQAEISTELEQLQKEQAQLRKQISDYEKVFPLLQAAAKSDFNNAVSRSFFLEQSDNTWPIAKINAETLQNWRQLAFEQNQATYQTLKASNNAQEAIAFLEQWLANGDFQEHLAERITLQRELNIWQSQRTEQQARAELERRLQERASLTREAYHQAASLAAKGQYAQAVKALDDFDWRPTDPEYTLVQEKHKTWKYAAFSELYRAAHDLAASGEIEVALEGLRKIEPQWPKEHPDYQRVRQKIKDWQKIMDQRLETRRKQGFLSNDTRVFLKELKIPILVSGDLPSQNTWNMTANRDIDADGSRSYRLLYVDSTTRGSFLITSGNGHYCGADFSNLSTSWFYAKPSYSIRHPQMGQLGIVFIEHLNAYAARIMRGKQCYLVISSHDYERTTDTMGRYLRLKRISKENFESVLKQLRWL